MKALFVTCNSTKKFGGLFEGNIETTLSLFLYLPCLVATNRHFKCQMPKFLYDGVQHSLHLHAKQQVQETLVRAFMIYGITRETAPKQST